MRQKPRIIAVLDDEPQMRKALKRLLSLHGFRVEAYAGGGEFLAALPLQPADCILLDLHMPDINGFDVLEAFQKQQMKTPVVVITGHGEPEVKERVAALGAPIYLNKPVDESALLLAIESAIAGGGPPRI